MREIGGTRAEIDGMLWDDFTADLMVAREMYGEEG